MYFVIPEDLCWTVSFAIGGWTVSFVAEEWMVSFVVEELKVSCKGVVRKAFC